MDIQILDNFDELSLATAKRVADYVNANPGALLCIAAGRTTLAMLGELVAMQRRREVDLASVRYAGLDEWVGLAPDDERSCYSRMTKVFYGPAGIPDENIRLFNGVDADMERQCAMMDDWISSYGGVGLVLLGIGMNGHVGFNEPGTPAYEGCLVTVLDRATVEAGAIRFGAMEPPLTKGITIGWRTLLDARNVILMAGGQEKAGIMKTILKGPATIGVPASMFQNHANAVALLDAAAASLL